MGGVNMGGAGLRARHRREKAFMVDNTRFFFECSKIIGYLIEYLN